MPRPKGEAIKKMEIAFNRKFGEGNFIRLTTNYLGSKRIYDARPYFDLWRSADCMVALSPRHTEPFPLTLYGKYENSEMTLRPRWSVPINSIRCVPGLYDYLKANQLFDGIDESRGTNSVYLSRLVVAICGQKIRWDWDMDERVRREADHKNENTLDDRFSNLQVLTTYDHARRHGFFKPGNIFFRSPDDEMELAEMVNIRDTFAGTYQSLVQREIERIMRVRRI